MKRSKKANILRKNLTKEEIKLWYRINNKKLHGLKFRRQHPIDNYILDFICIDKKLIIELDGSQHGLENNKTKDDVRDKYFLDKGYKILRFWNNEINDNIEGVLNIITKEIGG